MSILFSNQFRIALILFSAVMTLFLHAQASAIRQIDFKNFAYPWNEPGGVPSEWQWMKARSETNFRLTGGMHRFVEPGESDLETERFPLISLTSVTYGDLDRDGSEEAAVALNYGTGGTANWDYLYIYKLARGRAVLLARLQSGSRADGGLVAVSIKNGLLVLEFADTERRVADCCSEGFVRVHYRLHRGEFVETGRRERGDLKLQIH